MTIFTRLPITVSNPNLAVIPTNNIKYLATNEYGAYEHWVFDRGATSLTGLVNSRALTVQGATPTYNSNNLSLSKSFGNGLISPKDESRNMTMCFVYKVSEVSGINNTLAGTRGNFGTAGSFMFGTVASGVSQLYSNQTPAFQAGPLTVSNGTWVFAALSEDDSAGTMTDTVFVGGGASSTLTGGTLKTVSTNKVALGNAYTTDANAGTQQFAEFIIFDRSLTVAEIADVYGRSKKRMAALGISVV